jgi:hypothetical protein
MKVDVKKPEPIVPPPAEYIITLTEDEAYYLYTLVGSVGGNGPLRMFANSLYRSFSHTDLKFAKVSQLTNKHIPTSMEVK